MLAFIKALFRGERKPDTPKINYQEPYAAYELREQLRQQYREEMATRIIESRAVCTFEEWRRRKGTENPVSVMIPVTQTLHQMRQSLGNPKTIHVPQLALVKDEQPQQPITAHSSTTDQHAVQADRLARVVAAENMGQSGKFSTYPEEGTQRAEFPLRNPVTKGLPFD